MKAKELHFGKNAHLLSDGEMRILIPFSYLPAKYRATASSGLAELRSKDWNQEDNWV